MCDFGIALGLLSAGIGAAGAIQQGQAAADQADYAAKVEERNAKIAEFKARDAVIRGNEETKKQRAYTANILAKQRAAMAANNIDVTYGSALDAAVDTAMLGELDALTVQSNSYREAYDYKLEAANSRSAAEMRRMEGKSAKTASYLSAAGTLVGGFGDAYSTYKKNSSPFVT